MEVLLASCGVEVKDANKHSQCIGQPLTAKDDPSPVDLKSSNLSIL